MIDALISTAGFGYFIAAAAVAIAALIAKAGAARAPAEEPERRSAIMVAVDFISVVTPLLLVLYACAVTLNRSDNTLLIILMALPIVSGFVGALAGAMLSLAARNARAMFRMASIVAAFGAFILALGVTWANIAATWLVTAAAALTP